MLYDIFTYIAHLTAREDGQDLIEYGLLAFLISVAAVSFLLTLGTTLSGFWSSIVSQIP